MKRPRESCDERVAEAAVSEPPPVGLASCVSNGVRAFIELLRTHNLESVVKLPTIAVVGDTSSGKSSLLSAISRFEFPAHQEICTRCPTRLHLEHRRAESYRVDVEWKDNEAHENERFSKSCKDIRELQEAMIEAQNFVMERSKTKISPNVVHVNLCRPDVVDLTIVDLPGIVRMVGRDEDPKMIQQIRSIIDDYLKNERCVILAVHPANVDFHNSQVMSDARIHDPETKRTFPVVTKADLVEEGNEQSVLDLLNQKKTECFKLGFHIVKCRSTKDIAAGVSISDSINEEREYFSSHEKWQVLGGTATGTEQLATKLSDKYMEMLAEHTPKIKTELVTRLNEVEDRISRAYVPITPVDFERVFLAGTERIQHDLKLFVEPAGRTLMPVAGGSASTFQSKVEALKKQFFDKLVELTNDVVSEEEIQSRMKATKTSSPCMFLSQQTFQELIAEELTAKWEPIVMDLFSSVAGLLKQFFELVEKRIVESCNLPRFQSRLRSIIFRHLDNAIENGKLHFERHWECEIKAANATNNHYMTETIQKKRAESLLAKVSALNSPAIDRSPAGVWVSLSDVKRVITESSRASIDEYMAEEARFALSGYLRTLAKIAGDSIPSTIQVHLVRPALCIDFRELIPLNEREELLSSTPEMKREYEHLCQLRDGLKDAVKQARSI
jgi:GTPase SAR1 family protein